MKKFFFYFVIINCFYFHLSFAGGFQVNLQGQRQAAMGHCGTGTVTDAAGIFFNPGTISFLNTNSVTAGVNFIFHKTEYLEPSPGIYTTETKNTTGTPVNFYAAFRFLKNKKLSAGLGINTPFGSKVEYEENWKGQFLLREIDLKTFFIQPTLAYKITDKIGIGAGFVFSTGSMTLRKAIPVQFMNENYGEGILQGDAKGTGFNLGLFVQLTEKFSLGLSYRSSVKVKVKEGDASFSVPVALSEYFPNTSFTTEISLPYIFNFGAGYKISEKTKVVFDLNYVGWKSYDTLSFDFAENTEKLEDIHSARRYKNSFIFRAGVEYKWKENIFLRGGAYYDQSPVQDGYLTPETPDVDKFVVTCGAGIKVNKYINADFSFLYITAKKRFDTNIETGFSGTWKTNSYVPGINLTLNF
ncbi:MAG: outer membrane protein transport protein [Bacteroidota bacterium]